jgi:hypothetical protein
MCVVEARKCQPRNFRGRRIQIGYLNAEHWRMERMAAVDRNLMRAAVAELLAFPETPRAVVINEALEIARKFSSPESVQFINGVLDSVGKKLEGARELARLELDLAREQLTLDLAQMDERQNPADSFDFDDATWMYRLSREVREGLLRGLPGHADPRSWISAVRGSGQARELH